MKVYEVMLNPAGSAYLSNLIFNFSQYDSLV